MALVEYSDSESETESTVVKETTKAPPTAKPAFQKAAPGKIKVDLPTIKPEPGQTDNASAGEPPAKRARTGGAFSGFNSFLPAPKRTQPAAPKAGVSLKTSSEAAFSRNPPPQPVEEQEYEVVQLPGSENADEKEKEMAAPAEPKLVGKATKFLPLSVSNKKKKKPIAKPVPVAEPVQNEHQRELNRAEGSRPGDIAKPVEKAPKPKRSLFAVQQEEEAAPTPSGNGVYEPMMREHETHVKNEVDEPASNELPVERNPNSLEATAADLNLTPGQRRQLFGRNGGKDANVMHFSLNNEYAANEEARQAGEGVEHRAVKAIAPGKHSLKQLVNNAKTQQDAIEDKWAEGRRNRGEGGSKYGWSG